MPKLSTFACLLSLALVMSCVPEPVVDSPDVVKADPKHYKVEFENEHIRVLRATYGPHEKSPMHSHPANVVITLSGGHAKEILADGRISDGVSKGHEVGSGPAITHSMENLEDSTFESVVIELKDGK